MHRSLRFSHVSHVHSRGFPPAIPARSFNETLMRENELFESYLQRAAPQVLKEEEDATKRKNEAIAAAASAASRV